MGWAGHVARVREERTAYTVLVGKIEVRRPLWGTWRNDGIDMDLEETR